MSRGLGWGLLVALVAVVGTNAVAMSKYPRRVGLTARSKVVRSMPMCAATVEESSSSTSTTQELRNIAIIVRRLLPRPLRSLRGMGLI